jgi:hypothetical protein
MVSVTLAEWLIEPEVAARPTEYGPAATIEATLTVTICGDEAVTVNDAAGATLTPAGRFEICTVTEPVKPLSGVTLTLNVVDAPDVRVRDWGDTPIKKSGDGEF